MSYYPTFTRAEGAAYYRFADMMRKLEWEIHHKFWRGEGLPEAWHEIATDHGPGPKERKRMLYHSEASKARYVEMKRERGELGDVPEDWRKPRRR